MAYLFFAEALIWLTMSRKKQNFLPTVFSGPCKWINSKAPKGTEPVLRRLITLIFAGWVPHDLAQVRKNAEHRSFWTLECKPNPLTLSGVAVPENHRQGRW